jgi:N,N'-diacetyllegionaminate synthase
MNKSYFYTESAFHHEGDLAFMLNLIVASKEAGAQGIKFQVLIEPSNFFSSAHPMFKQLSTYTFSLEQWTTIFIEAQRNDLEIIMMPLDLASLKLLNQFPVKYLDIHSVSFYDEELILAVRKTGIPVILGVGGRTLAEIEEKKDFFGEQLKVLMVGFQSFPSKIEDVKLNRIAFLKAKFPELMIGYADHSAPSDPFCISSNEFARLLGAEVFEKHISTCEGVERIDSASAVSVEKIGKMISAIRLIEDNILNEAGIELMRIDPVEQVYRERQKKVVVNIDLNEGATIEWDQVSLKMTGLPDPGFHLLKDVVGKKLTKSVLAGYPLDRNCI